MKSLSYNKRGMTQLLLVITLIAGSITILGALGYLDVAGIFGFDSSSVYISEYGTLSCQEDDTHQTTTKYADQNYEFVCGGDYLVDECYVYGYCSGTSWYKSGCNVYDESGVRYSVSEGQRLLLTTLKVGEKITFDKTFAGTNEGNLKLEYERNPYRLWAEEFGRDFIQSSSDCSLANQNSLQMNQFEWGDWDALNKGEVRNYFLGWTKVYGAKIYGDKICLNNNLYSIDRVELADGSSVNKQGNKIRAVECCPHTDNNCDSSTFTFQQSGQEEGRTCIYDYNCANGGEPWDNPYSSTNALIENCVNGQCVEDKISIECDSDVKCVQLYGDGYGCDLSYVNYGNCIKLGQINQTYCGDLVCQTGETKENCPSDCSLECPEGWFQVTEQRKENCMIGFPLYLGCDKVVTTKCEEELGTNWALWLGLGAIVILLFFFRGQIFAVLKGGLGKIGVKI